MIRGWHGWIHAFTRLGAPGECGSTGDRAHGGNRPRNNVPGQSGSRIQGSSFSGFQLTTKAVLTPDPQKIW